MERPMRQRTSWSRGWWSSGILQEFTGRSRNRRFAYQSYIDLFQEETEGYVGVAEDAEGPASG